MAYTPNTWEDGEIITAEKMNNLENGVKSASETPGTPGAAAGFGQPTATVDANTGTPSVSVSASGPDTAKVFAFTFSNLKGAKGDKGDKGDQGEPGATYTLPAATTSALGGVKQATALADVAAAPTMEEFNALLAALRAAGILASS